MKPRLACLALGAAVCSTSLAVQAEPFAKPNAGPISLSEAIEKALANNLEIRGAISEVHAREGAVVQAAALPNPELGAEVENFGGSGPYGGRDGAETTIAIRQLLELGGKRSRREAVAQKEQLVAAIELESVRAEVIAETTKAFVKALALQERVALIERMLKSARGSVATATAQVRAGGGSSVDALRTEVEVEQFEARGEKLRRELRVALLSVAALWGEDDVVNQKLTGDLYKVSAPEPFHVLREQLSSNAEIRRSVAAENQLQAVVARERANSIPDLTAAVGGRQFNEDDETALVFEVSVPLPIFNRNQGAIAEARHRLEKAAAERQQANLLAESGLKGLCEQALGQFNEIERLRSTIIPKAEQAVDGALEGYQRGVFRALEVLDAQRTLFEVRSAYLETLVEYHSNRAEIERLTTAEKGREGHDN